MRARSCWFSSLFIMWSSRVVVFAAIKIWPAIRGYLPIGGVEQLISQPAKNPLAASEAVRAAHVGNLGQSMFWLVVAIIGALLTSLPVSWVYMGIRDDEEYDQSLINTILVLPMVVTGIVIIVQNSPRPRILARGHRRSGAVPKLAQKLGRRACSSCLRSATGLSRASARSSWRRCSRSPSTIPSSLCGSPNMASARG